MRTETDTKTSTGRGDGDDPRRLHGAALARALRESRATTLTRTEAALREGRPVPMQAGVNPLAWELCHLAWFADFWTRRGPHLLDADGFVVAAGAALDALSDARYDSSRFAHAERWTLAPPPADALLDTLAAQLATTIAAIPDGGDDDALAAHRLALFHEDMHAEAFAWTAATLGWPAPPGLDVPPGIGAGRAPLAAAAGSVRLGRGDDEPGFAFDNERPATTRSLAAFDIDAAPRSAGDMLAFVADGGYADASLWPGDAGAWRAERRPRHPERWRPTADGGWEIRWFDRWLPLDPGLPALHLSAYEAEAWARWAGRRLPSAAEWERAAVDPAFTWGDTVWEWTSDAFLPYPGFVAGAYRDYSAPWFGDHRELRGGAFATSPRLVDRHYRNFFQPGRTDLFTGFRTARA